MRPFRRLISWKFICWAVRKRYEDYVPYSEYCKFQARDAELNQEWIELSFNWSNDDNDWWPCLGDIKILHHMV